MGQARFVLILAEPDDEHALHIGGRLTDAGHRTRVLNTADFPSDLSLSYRPETNWAQIEFPGSDTLDWSEVHSVYWRQYAGVGPSVLPDAEQAFIAENDSRSLVESMLGSLPGRWINSYRAWCLHQVKPAQLARVCGLGLAPALKVPHTLLTNSPGELKDFVDSVGRCIFKPVQGGAHTRVLTPDHLSDENLENLRHAPVTVQQYVEGVDIRVFIAGEKVMACRLDTDALDFREDPNVRIDPHALSEEVSDACRRIARALHLLWTGIDLRLTADGQYFFFEANPSPMFLGFESRCGLPLTDALVDLLVG